VGNPDSLNAFSENLKEIECPERQQRGSVQAYHAADVSPLYALGYRRGADGRYFWGAD
jgi:hypothetical protein